MTHTEIFHQVTEDLVFGQSFLDHVIKHGNHHEVDASRRLLRSLAFMTLALDRMTHLIQQLPDETQRTALESMLHNFRKEHLH